jgi:uncharacterized membrane protein
MKAYVVAYVGALLAVAALDIAWLSLAGAALFKRTLGDVLLSDVRLLPALLFYAVYPIGIVIFAISPALRSGTPLLALGLGALFGCFAYATYDLTNFATVRGWTAQLTMIDITAGTILSAAGALAGYYVATWLS